MRLPTATRIDARYVARRTLQALLVIALTYVLVFVVLYVLPGDPIRSRIENPDSPLPQQDADKLLQYYGLDKSLPEQFLAYSGRILQGDFGYSLRTGLPVHEMILDALPSTLALASLALAFSILLSLAISLAAVFAPGETVRSFFHTLPGLFLSVPTFVTGLLLLYLFSFELGWVSSIRDEGFKSLVLPALTLALAVCAPIAQVLIQGLEKAANAPFVATLRAQGNTASRIVGVHVLKNAAIPAITLLGLTAAELLAGSVVTEIIFNRRGIGWQTEQAVTYQDSPVVLFVTVLVAAIFTTINLVTDLVYPLIDPRVDKTTPAAPRRSRRQVAESGSPA
ncbi:ABC transporter permease [Gordonia rubripertincta]|uniref:ABC transporter permease n=1 Tax=Gordonia rubripertincta TaxID=36822 RepID=UPI000B8D43D6|nr:ABC transporter permease [Gordonia rubripertincta]ASR04032.1 Glutathione transport system permease protein GsiC [Gordonia rubripertincta]